VRKKSYNTSGTGKNHTKKKSKTKKSPIRGYGLPVFCLHRKPASKLSPFTTGTPLAFITQVNTDNSIADSVAFSNP